MAGEGSKAVEYSEEDGSRWATDGNPLVVWFPQPMGKRLKPCMQMATNTPPPCFEAQVSEVPSVHERLVRPMLLF